MAHESKAHDNVLRMSANSWKLGVGNVFQGVPQLLGGIAKYVL